MARHTDWADADDPVEELHKIRRQLIQEAGGTLEAYVRQIMEWEKQHPVSVVTPDMPVFMPEKPARKAAKITTKAKAKTKTPARKPAAQARRRKTAARPVEA